MSAERDKPHHCKLFGASPTDLIFLVASYVLVPRTMELVSGTRAPTKGVQAGFRLVIKPHADEGTYEYERILQEKKLTSPVVSTGVPLYSLLNASDIVFTAMSTVGSEAVLFDKPLICLNLSSVPYNVRQPTVHVV